MLEERIFLCLLLCQHNGFQQQFASVCFGNFIIFFLRHIRIIRESVRDKILVFIYIIMILAFQQFPSGHQVIGGVGRKLLAVLFVVKQILTRQKAPDRINIRLGT